MPDDIRLARWDLRASAGTTQSLAFTSPTALPSLSVWTGGLLADVDDLAGATEHPAVLSVDQLTATVELDVPTGSSVPLRLTIGGAVQTVGRLVPSTTGTDSADNTISLAPAETTYTLTILGVVASETLSAIDARLTALEAAALTTEGS